MKSCIISLIIFVSSTHLIKAQTTGYDNVVEFVSIIEDIFDMASLPAQYVFKQMDFVPIHKSKTKMGTEYLIYKGNKIERLVVYFKKSVYDEKLRLQIISFQDEKFNKTDLDKLNKYFLDSKKFELLNSSKPRVYKTDWNTEKYGNAMIIIALGVSSIDQGILKVVIDIRATSNLDFDFSFYGI